MDDDRVPDTARTCAADVTTETHAAPGASDPNVIVLRQGGGLARSIRLDTLDAALVSVSDGELTARQSLIAISALLDLPTGSRSGPEPLSCGGWRRTVCCCRDDMTKGGRSPAALGQLARGARAGQVIRR